MTSDLPLTVVVVSFNDGPLLGRCLSAFASWAQEIILLDMHSDDESVKIAEGYGARIVAVPRRPIAEQIRQVGLDESKTDWVFFVDPDEVLPPDTREACLAAIASHPDAAAFRWPFRDFFFEQPLTHSRQAARKIVVVHRSRIEYSANAAAHEEPNVTGPVINLSPDEVPPIQHFTFRSVPQIAEKFARYASTGNPIRGQGIHGHSLMLPRLWFREVIGTRAWRDGKAGIDAASLAALHDYVAALRQWEIAGAPPKPVRCRATLALSLLATTGKVVQWSRARLSRR